jgi:hypothetical protein
MGELFSTEVFFLQSVALYHRAHASIENEYTFLGDLSQRGLAALQPDGVTRFLLLAMVACLVLLYDAKGLFHFPLVMEVHLDVHPLAANMVEQWAQLVERYPTGHHALSAF